VKVAVTGATGFIGRAVLAELSNRGIVAVACSHSGSVTQQIVGHRVVTLDLHEPLADAFVAMGCPDVLIHLAWGGLPNYRSLHHFQQELPAHFRFLRGLIDVVLQNLLVAGTCF